MLDRLKKKYPTVYTLVFGILACGAVTLILTTLDFYFPNLWVLFWSVAVGLVVGYLQRWFLVTFNKIKPLAIANAPAEWADHIYQQKAKYPNAYARGFASAKIVTFTSRQLEISTPEELHGILMHEIGHHYYNDFLVGGFVIFAIGNGMAMIANLLGATLSATLWIASLLTPFGFILYLYYSRSKEKRADLYAMAHLGHPEHFASALTKIKQDMRQRGFTISDTPTFASKYLATHPPIPTRVQYLTEK